MIVERKDIEKIQKINNIIKEIQRKLDNGQYIEVPVELSGKVVNYIVTRYDDLYVYLIPMRSSIEGAFHDKDWKEFKAPFVMISNARVRGNKIGFDANNMAHELQHYLDYKEGIPTVYNGQDILKPEGGIKQSYYINPNEWSAHITQLLRQYFQVVNPKKLPADFKSFYKDFFRRTDAKRYYRELDAQYKQRFIKRLYGFHQKLLERKQGDFSEADITKEGVGDKYAQKAYGIPDADDSFEDKYQQHVMSQRKDPENGELVGHVMSGDPYEEEDPTPVNIYKNPKSLKNFGKYVRAVADKNGNIYVSQTNGDFMHGEMISALRLNRGDVVEFYRDAETNRFGVSSTFIYHLTKSYMDLSAEQIIKLVRNNKELQDVFRRVNKRNPDFEFSYLPQHQFSKVSNGEYVYSVLNEQQQIYNINDLAGIMQHMGFDKEAQGYLVEILLDAYRKAGDQGVIAKYAEMTGTEINSISKGRYVFGNEPTGGGEDMLEGVGDKYAEKAFNIPDIQDTDYLKQTAPVVRNKEMGELVGITTADYDDARLSAIYKNPQSLKNFDPEVRAVSDKEGNLYVAQIDGNFVHYGFNQALHGNIHKSEIFITWMRLGNTNKFAYSDSFMGYAQQSKFYNDIEARLDVLRTRQPEFEFIPKFYYFAEDEL